MKLVLADSPGGHRLAWGWEVVAGNVCVHVLFVIGAGGEEEGGGTDLIT